MGLSATSQCRFQIRVSTLCVKTTLGVRISGGMMTEAFKKSAKIKSKDSAFSNSRRASAAFGWQNLLIVYGFGEATCVRYFSLSLKPVFSGNSRGQRTTFL